MSSMWWRTYFVSAEEIFVPNLKVEFWPPLQSLGCQVNICQNEEQRRTQYLIPLLPGPPCLGLGMRLGSPGNETRVSSWLTNWMGPLCKFTILQSKKKGDDISPCCSTCKLVQATPACTSYKKNDGTCPEALCRIPGSQVRQLTCSYIQWEDHT